MKRIFAGIMFLCVTLFLFPSIGSAQSKQQGIDIFRQAQELQVKHRSKDDMEKALKKYEEALTIFDRVGATREKGVTINQIGQIYSSLGQYQKALEYLEKSLAISKKKGDVEDEGGSLNNIGYIYYSLSQYSKALECFEKSLIITRKIRDLNGEYSTLNNIGAIHRSLGQYTKALAYYEQSLAITKKIGDMLRREHESLDYWAQIGKYDEALKAASESLVIQEKTGVRVEGIKDSIANYYLDAGNMVQAEPLIKETKQDSTLGRLALINLDYPSAQKYYEKDLAWAEKTGNTDSLFRSYTGLASAYEGMEIRLFCT